MTAKRWRFESGFTFLEMVFVALLLTILVSIAAINYAPLQEQMTRDLVNSDLATIKAAMRAYYLRNGNFPTSLQLLKENPENVLYIDSDFADKFSRSNAIYHYDSTAMTVWSVGPDNISGTTDDIAITIPK